MCFYVFFLSVLLFRAHKFSFKLNQLPLFQSLCIFTANSLFQILLSV